MLCKGFNQKPMYTLLLYISLAIQLINFHSLTKFIIIAALVQILF